MPLIAAFRWYCEFLGCAGNLPTVSSLTERNLLFWWLIDAFSTIFNAAVHITVWTSAVPIVMTISKEEFSQLQDIVSMVLSHRVGRSLL